MNDAFDELAKNTAQSVTRRGALKKFGIGFAGIALASLGLAKNADAKHSHKHCHCGKRYYGCDPADSACIATCVVECIF